MKRLTETWRQKKPIAGRTGDIGRKDEMCFRRESGTKRLGRLPIAPSNRSGHVFTSCSESSKSVQATEAVKNSAGSKCVNMSFTSSFGPDFDADVISAVNSLEQGFAEVSNPTTSGCSNSNSKPGSVNWQTVAKTPSKSVPSPCRTCSSINPSKRKNSRTRKSGTVKPSLFGDCPGNSVLSDAVTPTHSPADKKRRENTPVSVTKQVRLQTPPQAQKTPTRVSLHDRGVHQTSSISNQGKCRSKEAIGFGVADNFLVTRKLSDSSGSLHKYRGKDEQIEIETDVSPASSDVSKVTVAARKTSRLEGHGQTDQDHNLCDQKKKGVNSGPVPAVHSSSSKDHDSAVNKGDDHNIVREASRTNTKHSDTFTTIRSESRQDVATKTFADAKLKSRSETRGTTSRYVSTKCPTSADSACRKGDDEGNGEKKGHPVSLDDKGVAVDRVLESTASTCHVTDSTHCTAADNPSSLLLAEWGLPAPVLEAYHSQGITTMFPWQAECLTTGNVLGGGNLVYSAPTSAGKTMVAELLMLKRVLETRRKALFILPFVSVTREKMISLQRLYQDAGLRVGGYMGGYSPAGGFQSLDVAVCTIEKGNGLVNRLLEENRIDDLGVVVIDELHMVGDSSRGYLLELLLTKVCYMARKSKENGISHPMQVIGMSATLPNLDLLARWLDANLYHTDFRPVPLTENIKVGTGIYDGSMSKVREVEVKSCFKGDDDHIIPLCLETLMGGHSVLIFCPTKVWCEKMAEKIAREFYELLRNPTALAAYTGETGFVKASEMMCLPINQSALMNVLEQLGRSPVGVDAMLGKVIQYGVAYHHAGLTFDERDIVEGAFRQGLLKVLVATSTLSSGVNLPARRVIIRSPMFGGRVMDTLSYKQMAGRAGRKGVDTEGECILVCKEGEKRAAQSLLQANLPPVTSCLSCGKDGVELSRSMKRAILEVVVSGVAARPADVARYTACTLLSASLPPDSHDTDTLISACLKFLEDNEFVHLQTVTDANNEEVLKYQPTQLGSAVLASSMSPDEGLSVFAELQKARQCFVLSSELHIIYLVTPVYSQDISANLDWYHFYCLWEKLSPDMRSVAKVVGVEEGFLAKAITGRVPSKTAAQARVVAVHKRFYTALALHELVQEVPLLEVARKYNCNKGQLQSLMQSAATFAGMVTVFCARLGWCNMELLLSQFQQRLTLGVTRELCDLVRIPLLTGTMARVLFNAGYQTVAAVAHAKATDLENVFRKAAPFQSNKKQEGESDWELEQRRRARCVWLAGRQGVTELEAATAIMDEAKSIIQQELGVHIDWQAGATNTGASPDKSVSVLESAGELRTPSTEIRHSSKSSLANAEQKKTPAWYRKQEGSDTTPPASSFKQGNSADRSRRKLSRNSSGRGSSGSNTVPYGKSPPDRRASNGSAASPKEVSFFGQVVVSPPPLLRTPVAGVQSPPAEIIACVSENSTSTPNRTLKASTPVMEKTAAGVVPFSSAASDSNGKTTSVKPSDRNCIVTTPKTAFPGARRGTLSKHSLSSSSGFISALRSSAMDTDDNKAGQNTTSTVTAIVDDKQSRMGDDDDDDAGFSCFDDSLILDSQTAHLLSGGISVAEDRDKRSPQSLTTSTPLPAQTCTDSYKTALHDAKPREHLHEDGFLEVRHPLGEVDVQSKVKGGPQTGVKPSESHYQAAADEISPSLYQEPTAVVINSGINQRNSSEKDANTMQAVPAGPSVQTRSPALHADDENLDADLFHSPLLSTSLADHAMSSIQQNHRESSPQTTTSGVRKDTVHGNKQKEGHMSVDIGVDTGDTSCELIAASHYERLAYVEEGLTGDESVTDGTDVAYQDLCITQNGAQGSLVCQDRDPEERFTSVKDCDVQPTVAQPSNNVAPEYDPQEDLAVAMNLGESFSFMECFGSKPAVPLAVESKPVSVNSDHNLESDGFTNTFSASALERAMADDMFSEQTAQPVTWSAANAPCQTSENDLKNCQTKPTGQKAGRCKRKSPDSACKQVSTAAPASCNTKEKKLCTDSAGSSIHRRSVTPQGEGDLVPPTPPDEKSTSAVLVSPCRRRTPLRACRNKPENSLQPKSQIFPGSHVKEYKKRSSNKENALEKQSLSKGKSKSCTRKKAESCVKMTPGDVGTVVLSKTPVRPEPEGKLADTQAEDTVCDSASTAITSGQTHINSDSATISSSPPLTQESFTIIDVCADAGLFTTFVKEWKGKRKFSISVACERKPAPEKIGGGIGGNFLRGKPPMAAEDKHDPDGVEIPGDQERVIVGLAVSWENRDAYYISLTSSGDAGNASLDDTMAAPPTDDSITQEERIQAVKDVLNRTTDSKHNTTVTAYDVKSLYNVLVRGLGTSFGKCQDPQIASWLLDPGAKEKTVHAMVTNYLPEDLPLLEGIGGGIGYGSLGLTVRNPGSGRMRAAAESIISRRLVDHFWTALVNSGLDTAFTDVEMPSVVTMARMELNGFGFSEEECESQKSLMMTKLSALEQEAYHLAGHTFSLTSPDDVAQVLYLELQLPVNGDPNASKPARTLGPSRRGKGRQKSSFSTAKDILEKLKPFHPLPGVILEWRRISSALTKHVYPLQKEKVWTERLGMYRIFGECQLHTATGRVSMSEPNLQNIPKDFDITLPDVIGESPPAAGSTLAVVDRQGRRAGHSRLLTMRGVTPQSAQVRNPASAKHMAVSMRHAFIPFKGGVMVAADYSQLELRVIAHLSGDKKLISILNDDGDVFKLIASQWKNTLPEAVTAEQRQQAKQVCYGMLYGIGAKALGEQLGVEENDAGAFIETFKAKYTGMRSYLRETVEKCRKQGYVTTITGRRRYLPAIKDTNPHARAQAERQAVNTTVQGSAADITKAAMNKIDQHLARIFPNARYPHRHLEAAAGRPQGGFLVLQLHDELIYEVSQAQVSQVARIIQHYMETTTTLSVRLPVKVKVGPSWGQLEEL